MEIWKFNKIMKKDDRFESPNGYKVVSKIRTNQDKERLKYLLNYNLSSN